MPPRARSGYHRLRWLVRSTLRKGCPIAVTGLGQYQRLVAVLLIDRTARMLYANDVARFRLSYPSYPVADTWEFTPSTGFDVSARIIRFRRLQSILACLPATLDILKQEFNLEDVISAFHDRWPPPPFASGCSRALAEGRRFTGFLMDHDSLLTFPYLYDLARYECLRMEVLLRPRDDSGEDDRFEARDRRLAPGDDAPILSPTVAIGTFDYDILDLARPDAAAPKMVPRRTCSLVLQRTRADECKVWPIGPLALETFRLCDGTRTIAEITAALHADVLDPEKSGSDQVSEVLNAAVARRLLKWSSRSR